MKKKYSKEKTTHTQRLFFIFKHLKAWRVPWKDPWEMKVVKGAGYRPDLNCMSSEAVTVYRNNAKQSRIGI